MFGQREVEPHVGFDLILALDRVEPTRHFAKFGTLPVICPLRRLRDNQMLDFSAGLEMFSWPW